MWRSGLIPSQTNLTTLFIFVVKTNLWFLIERDFFMALVGANLAVKDLTKDRLIELKHLGRTAQKQALFDLVDLTF